MFIRSFVRSFVRLFVRSFVLLFFHSFVLAFVRTFVILFICFIFNFTSLKDSLFINSHTSSVKPSSLAHDRSNSGRSGSCRSGSVTCSSIIYIIMEKEVSIT